MNVKNLVNVMNFHALLRVDKAKREAEKYFEMEKTLREMIDSITNNRNFALDKRILRVPVDRPVLNIYVGSDLGFCGGYNFLVNEKAHKDKHSHKILIGRKLWHGIENVVMRLSQEEYEDYPKIVEDFITESIKKGEYSEINICYNSYVDIGTVHWLDKRLFPFEFDTDSSKYKEDFVCETNMNKLLLNMITTYINFEIKLTAINSFAAENIMRQNSTSESLKKIDAMEEEKQLAERKEKNEKEFQKIVESFTRMSHTGSR